MIEGRWGIETVWGLGFRILGVGFRAFRVEGLRSLASACFVGNGRIKAFPSFVETSAWPEGIETQCSGHQYRVVKVQGLGMFRV